MGHRSRQHVFSGPPFEPKVGISRAVRSGNIIAVTGTAPLGKDGKTVAKGDAAGQARRYLDIIQTAIEELGAKLSDVTRTRILLTRMEDWEQVATVHGEFFGSVRPATTIMQVQVVRFIDPDWLVEIEADAAVESYSEGELRHSPPTIRVYLSWLIGSFICRFLTDSRPLGSIQMIVDGKSFEETNESYTPSDKGRAG